MITEVIALVSEILDVDRASLSETSSQNTVAAWDSVATITIFSELEARYGVDFDITEIVDSQSIGDIAAILSQKVSSAIR